MIKISIEMITFLESKEKMKEKTEKYLDSQLGHACAGSMVEMPPVNSKVFYFPQGHSEHAFDNVNFRNCPRTTSYIPCRVSAVNFMADPETDEVIARMRLVPIRRDDPDFDDDVAVGISGSENQEKPTSFAKTLTQSDASNGGGFSVPRYCAEKIFPRLDYSADPPVQTILAKDIHGETWKFRHIYRGTPRRHLLTTGWSTFVNHKKLVAGDSVVFMRAGKGDLCIGIRRAKRGIGGGPQLPFLREDEGRGRVKGEDVIEAVSLAANGCPFDVVYYPRASTTEYCVKANSVKAALRVRWCLGMRFKMAFETEDSSRISWFMGTISSVQVVDPIRWPDSPWRLLQVSWDEPDLLQNVKRVSPWLVELVSNMPPIHLSPFSLPRKKLRLPNSDFLLDGQIPLPVSSRNSFGRLPNNTPAGMQGSRHAQYGLALSNLHLNRLQSSLFPVGFLPLDRVAILSGASNPITPKPGNNENISCLLTTGNSTQGSKKSDSNGKATPFTLFGKPILMEQQTCSSDTASPARTGNSSSGASGLGPNQNGVPDRSSCEGLESGLSWETGHCKVFVETEDVGRTLDLSLLSSYEELYRKLADMFDIEIPEMPNRVPYRDATGAARQLGDQPFSDFVKTARRLTIVADSNGDNVQV